MSVLQALDGYYGRMAARGEAEPFGFTRQDISFALMLNPDGSVSRVRDLRTADGRKLRPQRLSVPRPKRTSNIQSNFLWDKTPYSFGVDTGKSRRLVDENQAFKALHLELLGGLEDPGIRAMLSFLRTWTPDQFSSPHFTPEMLGTNFAFALEGSNAYLHQSDAARAIWVKSLNDTDAPEVTCLVTGQTGPLETGHSVIKNVEGAQTAGAYLVSFNADAYLSYGKAKDASNAPTSRAAASQYASALNAMLERGSRNRLSRPVGDASVVFWADTSVAVDEAQAEAAEAAFAWLADPPPDDDSERVKVGDALDRLMKGQPVEDVGLKVAPGTRFHVLGLSPNAARLSVRWWLSDDFEVFARRLAEHHADLAIVPPPHGWAAGPSTQRLLLETLVPDRRAASTGQQRSRKIDEPFKFLAKNHPHISGEVMRAVLTGGAYPRTWLAAVIGRLRAGDDPSTGWHAAAIRAVLARQHRLAQQARPNFDPIRFDPTQEPPVSLNRDTADPAYNCGRLFATLESAQRGALGKVNATIRDRYMGAASATPASIFPLLIKNAQSHLGKMRKEGKGGWIERELEEIQDKIAFDDDRGYPRTLKLEAQGRFFLGYYHQRKAQFAKAKEVGEPIHDDEAEPTDDVE